MTSEEAAQRFGARADEWADWKWHMRRSISSLSELERHLSVSEEERKAIAMSAGKYRWQITPYYLSLMNRFDAACPIRRQAVPSVAEFVEYPNASTDPVGDTVYRKTNRVVHKYPDRAILLVTRICPVYCRHCTRKFHTTDVEGTYFADHERASFDADFEYLRSRREIRDVLLTGGDPLTYSDEKLDYLLSSLRAIPHIEILRIGSRYPVLLPQRVTEHFCSMLAQHHPVWFSTHFNHPSEITVESREAIRRLINHGIPVLNQSVLLRGVNDSEQILRKLCTELVSLRVRPYYLYHCDNVTGVSHFMTSVGRGQEIMRKLHGQITGFAVPKYVVTTMLGKVPIDPIYHEWKGSAIELRGYRGDQMDYQDE